VSIIFILTNSSKSYLALAFVSFSQKGCGKRDFVFSEEQPIKEFSYDQHKKFLKITLLILGAATSFLGGTA